jgi:non-heme chloroperoxidase
MAYLQSFDNIKLYYDYAKKSSSKALIFLHGWPLNHTVWKDELKYFQRKGYSTLALDLRGHGRSDKPSKLNAYLIENFAKDLYQVIKKEKIKNPTLIGHSFGGMIILKFVELYPKIPKSIVLMDTTYQNPLKNIKLTKSIYVAPITKHLRNYIINQKKAQKKQFSKVDFSKLKKDKSDFYYWYCGLHSTSKESVFACLKQMLKLNEKKILNKIRVPTLILEGEHDFLTPLSQAMIMNKMIKNSKLVIIQNASHDSNITKAESVSKEIYKFLNALN